ncbi:MAG: Uma2 family endonuclease [Clostridia bacterium]|nr:Uma2 family endonuclease [Clostridia bacterium]
MDDILAPPEGVRAELIDGRIYYMDHPPLIHQAIQGYIFSMLYGYAHVRNCAVFDANFGVYLTGDDLNFLLPDIAVICDREKLSERGCEGAPDLIVEIVTPASRKMDFLVKLHQYSSRGVREYWIVDPESQRTNVYFFEADDPDFFRVYSFDEEIPVEIFQGDLRIRLCDRDF